MRSEIKVMTLLRNMKPILDERQFVFCSVDTTTYKELTAAPIGLFHEAEGVTLILEKQQADRVALSHSDVWALITLSIHTDLTAVGFLAAVASKLAAAKISFNPMSAYYNIWTC